MPNPCEHSSCVGRGTIAKGAEECPGSDDENHHCVDCGELWWEDKGKNCEVCGGYWCPSWQHTFIFMNCPKKGQDFDDDAGVCPKCFLADKKYWCKSRKCDCDQKHDKVAEEWEEYQQLGSEAGRITLVNAEGVTWAYAIHDFLTRVDVRVYRVEVGPAGKSEHSDFMQLPEAIRDAQAEVSNRIDQGFTLRPKGQWETNPYGLLESIRLEKTAD